MGQGVKTTFSKIVAQVLGIAVDQITHYRMVMELATIIVGIAAVVDSYKSIGLFQNFHN